MAWQGDGQCAIDLGLSSTVPFDITTTQLLITAAQSLILKCILGFASGGPQGGYQTGLGVLSHIPMRQTILDTIDNETKARIRS